MTTKLNLLFEKFSKQNPQLEACQEDIKETLELLGETFGKEGTLFVCGNGGSASDALHIVGELQKSFVKPRRLSLSDKAKFKGLENENILIDNLENGFRAHSLVSEASLITAISNDTGADFIFAQQVWASGKIGDCLLCISTSGNSQNVVLAAETAKAREMPVISLTGANPRSKLANLSDVCIKVPSTETYKVQEMHLIIYHFLCLYLEERFFE